MRLQEGLLWWALGVFGGISCGPPGPAADHREQVLAQVGTEVIAVQDVERLVANLPAWAVSEKEGSGLVRDYLQTLIDRLLIVQEARSRGLEQSPSVQKDAKRALDQRLVEEVEKREIQSRVAISEEEVEQAFAERNWGRRLKIAHILAGAKERAEEAMAALQAGRPFDAVARELSENAQTAPHGGEKPAYYTRLNVHPAVRDSLFRLKVGEISGIIPVPKGYEIFKVLDERKVPYEKIEDKVYEELFQERLSAARKAYADSLAGELELTPSPQGLGMLMEVLRRAQEQGAVYVAEPAAGTALFRYKGGSISLGEAVEQSPFLRQAREVEDSLKVSRFLERDVVVPHLLRQRAYELGIDREPEIGKWLRQKQEDALILEIRRIEAAQKVVVTDQEVRNFYENNKDQYRTSSEVEVVEVLVEGEPEAEELLAEIRSDLRRAQPLVALLGRIRQKLAVGQAVGEEVRSLRDLGDDPEVFGWLRRRLANQREMTQVLEEISSASTPEDLVEQYIMRHLASTRSLRPGSRYAEGHYHLHWYEQGLFGPLVKEAMEARPGALIGPLKVDSSYAIAKILARQGSEIRPFEELKRGLAATLRENKEGELFARWSENLRAARRDQVNFFDENIEKAGQEFQAKAQGNRSPTPQENGR